MCVQAGAIEREVRDRGRESRPRRKEAEPVREVEVQRPKLTKREVLMLTKELGEEYRESVDRLKRWVWLLPVRAPGRPQAEKGSSAADTNILNREAFDCGPKSGVAQGLENGGDSTDFDDVCNTKGEQGGFGKERGCAGAAKRGIPEAETKSGKGVAGVDKKRRTQYP